MKIKNICCIGAGYVGGPTMAVIALKCPEIKINVVDTNLKKIRCWNTKDLNKLPVFEPGLSKIISKTRNKNLFFSTKVEKAIDEADMIFMAVNTPTKTSGKGKGMAADLRFVKKCAMQIAKFSSSDKIVVEKSTLPVRTAEKIKKVLSSENKKVKFEVISNPEFLAEGTAINDLFKSDRVLIGGDDTKSGQEAVEKLVEIYERWIPKNKILRTNVWSSELSKLVSNAMLAQRISSINSISALCEKTEANIQEVSKAVGMDSRIGTDFLKSSIGFGGSCFKKDILNLVYISRQYGLFEVADYWENVIKINSYQTFRFGDKIINKIKSNKGDQIVTILGWAFKKNTNDSRESASIYLTNQLLDQEIKIKIYDPMVQKERILEDLRFQLESSGKSNEEIKKLISQITIYKDAYIALKNSNFAAICTEWDEFKNYDWKKIYKNMKDNSWIFDGRNLLDKHKLQSIGFKTFFIGQV
jgi:UDPglucose 6-dehydrogenase